MKVLIAGVGGFVGSERTRGLSANGHLDWQNHTRRDDRYERPHNVTHLLGDPGKARREQGWKPQFSFSDLVTVMVDADLGLLQRQAK